MRQRPNGPTFPALGREWSLEGTEWMLRVEIVFSWIEEAWGIGVVVHNTMNDFIPLLWDENMRPSIRLEAP